MLKPTGLEDWNRVWRDINTQPERIQWDTVWLPLWDQLKDQLFRNQYRQFRADLISEELAEEDYP